MNSIMIFGIVLICCVMLWARISFDLSNPLFFLWSTWTISVRLRSMGEDANCRF